MTNNKWNSPYNDADGELLISNTSAGKPQVGDIISSNSTIVPSYSDPNINLIAHASCKQSSFLAYVSSTITNVTGAENEYNIVFDSTSFDMGSDFDTSNGRFTAPKDGVYYFTTGVSLTEFTGQTRLRTFFSQYNSSFTLEKNYELYSQNPTSAKDSEGNFSYSGSATLFLNEGEILTVRIISGISSDASSVDVLGSSLNTSPNTYFSGSLLS